VRRRDLLQSTGRLQLREAARPDNQKTDHDAGGAGIGQPEVRGRHQVREESRLRRHQRVQGDRGRLQQQRGVREHDEQLRVRLQDWLQTRQPYAGLRRHQRVPIAGNYDAADAALNALNAPTLDAVRHAVSATDICPSKEKKKPKKNQKKKTKHRRTIACRRNGATTRSVATPAHGSCRAAPVIP